MQPLEHLGSLPESENEGFFMPLLASPGLNITFVAVTRTKILLSKGNLKSLVKNYYHVS